MKHYYYGGDKDGQECPYSCREFIVTNEPNETPMDINEFNDSEFAIPFKEIRWIHCVYRNLSAINPLTHYYMREDIYNKMARV